MFRQILENNNVEYFNLNDLRAFYESQLSLTDFIVEANLDLEDSVITTGFSDSDIWIRYEYLGRAARYFSGARLMSAN